MDLVTVLSNAQSAVEAVRREAEAHLVTAEREQYGPFLLALCQELAVETKPINVRQLAGLQIKNLIHSNDARVHHEKMERWVACDAAVKEQARNFFLQALASQYKEVGRVAAQIIANYGAVDVPQGQWPNLMEMLFQAVTRPDVPDTTKVSALEALGFMCEIMDGDAEVPAEVVNKILGTIVDGMSEARSIPIRLAATTALTNSLDFTEANFAQEVERNAIVMAIFKATQCTDSSVRKAAYECLVKVADLYYDTLGPYVANIFELTTAAIRTDVEEVGIPALEFWATVCEVEIEKKEMIEQGAIPAPVMLNLIDAAALPLITCILEAMTRQPEEVDEDDWNICESASACLQLLAENIGKNVIPHVLPFIQQNIQSPDWKLRDAAVSAFGHIVAGPEKADMKPIVDMGLAVILQLTQDAHERVRWSATWTLGKICETHKESTDPQITSIVPAFMESLKHPNIYIVGKACFGITNLALACEGDDPGVAATQGNILSQYYYPLVEKLLSVAGRPDSDGGSFRVVAYETINALVESSTDVERKTNEAILVEAVNRLAVMCDPAQVIDPKERHDMQSSICTLVGQAIKKLDKTVVLPHADRIMQFLLTILGAKGISGNDDAAYAVGAVADSLEMDFERYVAHLRPMLLQGLEVHDDPSTCIISVGLLGDVCRAIKNRVCLPENGAFSSDEYVARLISLCQSTIIDRSVKPHVIALFADLAMAIEGDFDRYLGAVVPILVSAGEIVVETNMDEDTLEFVQLIRSSILEAYTGILQGLHSANKQNVVATQLTPLFGFLQRVAADEPSDECLKNLVGLLGDLAKVYGAHVSQFMGSPMLARVVENALGDDECEEVAKWALAELKKVAPATYAHIFAR